MSHTSSIDLRVLHAARTLGYAETTRIAAHVHAPLGVVHENLLDHQARGWIVHTAFGDDGGWSLTERGKTHGEHLLAHELDQVGARAAVTAAYEEFLTHNDAVGAACTAWQLAELGISQDPASLSATITALHPPATALARIEHRLTVHLQRFSGYHQRFSSALAKAATQPAWITATDRDSCHHVWFQLHEDLIATLGLTR